MRKRLRLEGKGTREENKAKRERGKIEKRYFGCIRKRKCEGGGGKAGRKLVKKNWREKIMVRGRKRRRKKRRE